MKGAAPRLIVALVALLPSAAALAQAPAETIVDIIVHGNHATPDAEILELAGLAIGARVSDAVIEDATRRLHESARFSAVEIRKRFASIADATRIVLVLLVDERPGASRGDPTPGPIGRFLTRTQLTPLLTYEDGYGLTYGAQLGRTDALGRGTRVSLPFTWGATRQASLVTERAFAHAPIDRLTGTVSISRREHPAYGVGDTRRLVELAVDRAVAPAVRLRGSVRAARVSFGGLDDSRAALRAVAVLDTRLDPTFPRDAVFASTSWERLAFRTRGPAIRVASDVRAYVGLMGSTVLALRAQAATSSAPLPPYEQALLGGSASLRGVRLGSAVGDNLLGGSIEVRVPLSSPLRAGRLGVRAFVDAAATWDVGERIANQRFGVGAGGGVYLGIGPFTASLDAARSGGRTRLHVGMGTGL